MSNLWFFRLRRAEQQRRRSSGEQSVGSASVQSAAGLSSSSLPPGAGCPTATSGTQPASGASACRQPQTSQTSGRRHLLKRDGRLQDADWMELESDLGEECAASDCFWPRELSPPPPLPPSRPEVGAEVKRMEFGGPAARGRPQQVPQVTIIRSDSTSSYIPMAPSELPAAGLADHCSSPSTTCLSNSGRASTVHAGLPFSAELDQISGQVESRLLGATTAGCCPEVEAAHGRHLHDQLSSGKVPPISQRLLNPAAGNLSLADSMDNLAALIPR